MVGLDCRAASGNQYEGLYNASVECNNSVLSVPYPDDEVYCRAVWDGLGCWNYAIANTTSQIPCPLYVPTFQQGNATKQCNSNGTWEPKADYSQCLPDDTWDKVIVNTYIAGYAVSVILLAIAMFIFIYFKQLHCVRVSIHRHLFLSYILNGCCWIAYYSLVSYQPEVLHNNPWWCQVLHVFAQYFVSCNFCWMFCEGLYLLLVVVVVFISEEKISYICMGVGWGFPVITTTTYALVRKFALNDTANCWIHESCAQWIVFAPIILILITNLVFLIIILVVLCTKLKGVNFAASSQNRKTAYAVLILIPLLGIQFVLLPMEPETGTSLDKVYQMISTIVVSFQGCFVAILFCFVNGEVRSALAKICDQWGYKPVFLGHRFSMSTSNNTQSFNLDHSTQ